MAALLGARLHIGPGRWDACHNPVTHCNLHRACRHLAREDTVQRVEGLPDQLRKGADLLEGPWLVAEQQQ